MSETADVIISAPAGTSQHGKPDFLCVPATWKTVVAFFVAKYVIHAFTLWRKPGEKTGEYIFGSVLALLFPMSGINRGLDAINRRASWQFNRRLLHNLLGFGDAEYEMRTAARAGALAVLARDHERFRSLQTGTGRRFFEFNNRN